MPRNFVNMPPPLAAKPFKKSSNTITIQIKTIAKESMSDAAAEIEVQRMLKIVT